MNGTTGTTHQVTVERVVDGDTVKVRFPEAGDESGVVDLRILCLDTEESRSGSGKPQTPWGIAAKEHATAFISGASTVTLEFPGTEPLDECLQRYRDNYGRLLVYLHVDGEDFQAHMIREGYSPYFNKYGYAVFDTHHERYREAERQAQADALGVWDQLAVNGAEMREYPTLSSWWTLRAETIERYREAARTGTVLDSRLDYDRLVDSIGNTMTVFTELARVERVGASHFVASNGSRQQRFDVFLPNALETEEGQRILSLLRQRYVAESTGKTVQRPARSYAFVTGVVREYPPGSGEPEITVTSVDQLSDVPPRREI